MSGRAAGDVVVMGSLNADLVLPVGHLPRAGETVLGGELRTLPGGKGGNQAVAAARLGGRVFMVGRVGEDSLGAFLLERLARAGVDTGLVAADPASPTGTALVLVDERGENCIAVAPGANARVGEPEVARASGRLRAGDVLAMQLEVPVEAVLAAAERARAVGATVVLNASPAGRLIPGLLALVDVLVVNELEAAGLAGTGAGAGALASLGPGTVVVTRGSGPTSLYGGGREVSSSPPRVDPIDTTGAGDAFAGALALALARGLEAGAAVRVANAAGAAATLSAGAQEALPTVPALVTLDPGAAAALGRTGLSPAPRPAWER
ncbi:MAG: ribokinase [Candidatus Dormibacterales bacterium]